MSSITQIGDYREVKQYGQITGWEVFDGSTWKRTQTKPTSGENKSNSGGATTVDPPITLNINKPAASTSSLRYPRDLNYDQSDYVLFSFYNYAPPFGSSRAITETPTTRSTGSAGYVNYASSNDRSYANPSNLKSIILYMPEDIQTQFGAGWNGAGFGAAAAGVLNVTGAAGGGQDLVSKIQAGFPSGAGGLKAAAFSEVVKKINEFAGASITTNQAIGSVTGTIINPNVELLYEAPKLRNFSLKFKLVPRSDTEADIIRNICNTFKKSMLPSFGGSAIFGLVEAPNLISIPNLCQVNFMTKNNFNEYLPKYKLCGITDVNINYTAAGAYSTVGDKGSPTATELTVSFLESKLVFADEVDDTGGTGI
jgi:hypothetical protein